MSHHAYRASVSSHASTAEKAARQQGRRSTPDSEALASSDDDNNPEHALSRVRSNPVSARRQSSSWLNDIQPHRKVSLGGGSQTGGSQPPTPSAEQGSGHTARTSSGSAFPWNAGVFSPSRDGPSRLKEVIHSPTSLVPGGESLPSPPLGDQPDSPIGFLLNQHPVRKAVRSQSYSVGQQDAEPTSPLSGGQFTGRMRGGPTSLRHRPSKPSLLGETPLDSSGLPQLLEDDDDLNSCSNGSDGGLKLPASYLARQESSTEVSSNALLKQAAEQNARARHRASTTASPSPYNHRKTAGPTRGLSLTEFDSAIEEIEDNMQNAFATQHSGYGRRYSEHTAGPATHISQDAAEEMPKRPHWSTSLSFGEAMDSPSRRHSFADVQSHQTAKPFNQLGHTDEEEETTFPETNYFNGSITGNRSLRQVIVSEAHPDPEIDHTTNPYAVPPVINRPTRRFYMVAFKCSRADVYYLPENTGLELQQGDMVITEGDRGVDLGTVTHADVTLADAKKYKELAAIEHFKWLMMFSRHALQTNKHQIGPNGLLATGHQGVANALGGLTAIGTTLSQQYVAQMDMELKPRLIRRVAQNHEIQVLREKEGSEAKAKRICQAKVAEHGFNMEILDAEYQLDYKKLTFYYYSEAYINFNELVTELFKVYKTRIWMSAINPDSFASAAGMKIPPPSIIGPGAVGPGTKGPGKPRSTRPPANNLPPLPDLPSNIVPMTGPLPVGLGYTRNAFQLNDEFGTVRGSLTMSMEEEARKSRQSGMPMGMAPFTTPGVNTLRYQFPTGNVSQPTGAYYPFETQVPGMGGAFNATSYGEIGMPGQWGQPTQAPPQPVSRYNQYAMTSPTFPVNTYPSPAPGMTALAPGGYPPASRSSPVPGMTLSASGNAFYPYNQVSTPTTTASMGYDNTFQNQYPPSSQPPSAGRGRAPRFAFPDPEYEERMSKLTVEQQLGFDRSHITQK